jgi:hypothetical protein
MWHRRCQSLVARALCFPFVTDFLFLAPDSFDALSNLDEVREWREQLRNQGGSARKSALIQRRNNGMPWDDEEALSWLALETALLKDDLLLLKQKRLTGPELEQQFCLPDPNPIPFELSKTAYRTIHQALIHAGLVGTLMLFSSALCSKNSNFNF